MNVKISQIVNSLFAVALLTGSMAMAADEKAVTKTAQKKGGDSDIIVVTATRSPSSIGKVGSDVSVITRADIESKSQPLLIDVLRDTVGVHVARNGGPGTASSLFLRGANSGQTLVLIDGIEVGDTSSSSGSFNLAHLGIENIERIEVVRGAQNTLYGSDAIGGVINIITREGKGDFGGEISLEAGVDNYMRESASASGKVKKISYSVSVSHLQTDGFSAASEENGHDEDDGYENNTLASRLVFDANDIVSVGLVTRYTRANADADAFGTTHPKDDLNAQSKTTQRFGRFFTNIELLDGKWSQELGIAYSNTARVNLDDIDTAAPTSVSKGDFDGRKVKFDWRHNLYVIENHVLTLGMETEKDTAVTNTLSVSGFGSFATVFDEISTRTSGYYLQDQVTVTEDINLTLGLRHDRHSDFGGQTTYRAAVAWSLPQAWLLRSSIGSGFKTPTLFQLYSAFGDVAMAAEESVGWDVGLERRWLDHRLKTTMTYFANRFNNAIEFDSGTSKFANVGKTRTQGVELVVLYRLSDRIDLDGGYTYTDAQNAVTGRELLRRPRQSGSLGAYIRYSEKGNVHVQTRFFGNRYSNYNVAKLGSYTIVNVAVNHSITKDIDVFARMDNFFDEEYEEVTGFGTAGASAFVGAKYKF